MHTTGRAENSTAGAQEQDTAIRHPLLGGREVPSAMTPGAAEGPWEEGKQNSGSRGTRRRGAGSGPSSEAERQW